MVGVVAVVEAFRIVFMASIITITIATTMRAVVSLLLLTMVVVAILVTLAVLVVRDTRRHLLVRVVTVMMDVGALLTSEATTTGKTMARRVLILIIGATDNALGVCEWGISMVTAMVW
jgi:hypothetical protein